VSTYADVRIANTKLSILNTEMSQTSFLKLSGEHATIWIIRYKTYT
jgi:hypothetical protein